MGSLGLPNWVSGVVLGLSGTKVLRRMLYSVQPMLSEASSQVGVVPVAVSWVWRPGVPCGGGFLGSSVGLLPLFPACWSHGGRRM